jgi:putative heme-binding domain-containing protein
MMRVVTLSLILTAGLPAQPRDEREIAEKNPYQTESDVARGKQLFMGQCAPCHGPEGDGGKGANLARPVLPRAADDRSLFRVIEHGIPGSEMPPGPAMTDHEIWQVAAYVRSLGRSAKQEAVTGDRSRGEQLFRGKGNCLQCHTVGREGGSMGPQLTDVGDRRSAAFLRQTLLEPAATVPTGFAYVDLVTKGKKRVSGIRLGEDTYSIQVRDLSGNLHSYFKGELAEIHKDTKRTPMPSYGTIFSDSETNDVIAYLLSLRGLP